MTQTPNYVPGPDPLSQVKGPAIGLMITAGVGIALQLVALVLNLLGTGLNIAAGGDQRAAGMLQGGFGIVTAIIGLIVGGIIFFGASKMMKLQSYNLAMTAAIIAMIPCISPCCLAGLPLGIWAIVVLVKPEVKAAFTA